MAEPDLDLQSGKRRVGRIVAVVAAVVLGAAAYVVFRLATEDRGAAPCDHLAELAKTDPGTPNAIAAIVRYVETNFVELGLTSEKEASVGGSTDNGRCRAAFRLLDQALSHTPFQRIADCVTAVPSAAAVQQCLDDAPRGWGSRTDR